MDIPADRRIDPRRLQAWIEMTTVTGTNPSPGAAFIYVDDLAQGFRGHANLELSESITFDVSDNDLTEAREVARELEVGVDELASSAFTAYMDGIRVARRGDVDEPIG